MALELNKTEICMRDVDRQLLDAANAADAQGVQKALEQGADPNSKGRLGRSAIMRSALLGDNASLQLLLRAGADPAAVDDLGRSCLMYAALGQGPCFNALLSAGANPNALDQAGESALDYAAAAQFEAMVQALLRMGATQAKARSLWLEVQARGWLGVAAISQAWFDALEAARGSPSKD
jgi:ankyrin repeat protein